MTETLDQKGWLARLKSGLAKSSGRITAGLAGIAGRKLDDSLIEEIEEILIAADLGPATAAKLAGGLARTRFDQTVTLDDLRATLATDIAAMLAPVAQPLRIDPARKPHVVLVVGVNGSGKTTTVAKLAKQLRDEGRSVTLAAGDTFRAAAVGKSVV